MLDTRDWLLSGRIDDYVYDGLILEHKLKAESINSNWLIS